MGTKQMQFNAMLDRACPGLVAALEKAAAASRHPKIITENIYPPIPIRQFDWQATFDGYEPGDYVGYGRTEQDAIDDLKQQWEDDNGQFGVGA